MASAATQLRHKVLSFWFEGFTNGQPLPSSLIQLWFSGGEAIDNECRNQFGKELEEIFEKGSYTDELKQTPEGTLSLTVLLDQISRNLFRKTARPFVDFDPIALETAKYCINRNWDEKLNPIQRLFIYMPLEHSERMEDQQLSIQKFRWNAENSPEIYAELLNSFVTYSENHKTIIEQFGRFPHRNKYMNRESTKEEIDFLEIDGEIFNQ